MKFITNLKKQQGYCIYLAAIIFYLKLNFCLPYPYGMQHYLNIKISNI